MLKRERSARERASLQQHMLVLSSPGFPKWAFGVALVATLACRLEHDKHPTVHLWQNKGLQSSPRWPFARSRDHLSAVGGP
eukprot:4492555-Amphidinium_carterae.1